MPPPTSCVKPGWSTSTPNWSRGSRPQGSGRIRGSSFWPFTREFFAILVSGFTYFGADRNIQIFSRLIILETEKHTHLSSFNNGLAWSLSRMGQVFRSKVLNVLSCLEWTSFGKEMEATKVGPSRASVCIPCIPAGERGRGGREKKNHRQPFSSPH